MSYEGARFWIIVYSTILTGLMFPFFFLGPVIGYPLDADQARQSLSLVQPVFLGYLGAAVAFIFNPPRGTLPEQSESNKRLLGVLIHGAFLIFAVALLGLIVAFGISNRKNGLPGSGMQFSSFTNGITNTLSIMTVVVGYAVIYLFGVSPAKSDANGQTSPDHLEAQRRTPP